MTRLSRTSCLGLAVAAVAAVGALATAGGAGADPSAGSGLGSFSLYTSAPGIEWTYDSPTAPTHPEADSEVPETIARLQPGPIGYALGTVAWPGTLAANGGSTAGLVGLTLPQPLAANANEPVRAEARTGSGPPTVTNDSYPGIHMTATATDQEVSGYAVVNGTSGPAPSSSSGQTSSSSQAQLVGATSVTATALSTVKDLDLAGVVKITSVVSQVTITSDGTTPKATGSTVVSGATIAGQPVSIDQSGVHVVTASAPLNAVASQIVNSAIASAGMKIEVSQPSQTMTGGALSYTAGSLVFFWSPPGSGGQTFTATVGGASASVQAALGTPLSLLSGVAPSAVGATGAAGSGAAVPSASSGSGLSSSTPGGGSISSTGGGTAATVSGSVGGRLTGFQLPGGLWPGWLILFLLGSGIMAFGLRRLPDRVLEADASAECQLEAQS